MEKLTAQVLELIKKFEIDSFRISSMQIDNYTISINLYEDNDSSVPINPKKLKVGLFNRSLGIKNRLAAPSHLRIAMYLLPSLDKKF